MDNLETVDSYLKKQNKLLSVDEYLNTPNNVQQAQNNIGEQNDNGECQAFVEKMTLGHAGIYPSAADAWKNYVDQGKAIEGLKGAKPGDIIYFNDPNQSNGHTGILTNNNGDFISATNTGVQTNNINDWIKNTGQQLLGHISQGGQ